MGGPSVCTGVRAVGCWVEIGQIWPGFQPGQSVLGSTQPATSCSESRRSLVDPDGNRYPRYALVEDVLGVSEATLESWAERFGPGVVGRCFDDTQDVERRTFVQNLELEPTKIDDLGPVFDRSRLQIDIRPDDAHTANEWASWLLWDGLTD